MIVHHLPITHVESSLAQTRESTKIFSYIFNTFPFVFLDRHVLKEQKELNVEFINYCVIDRC